LFVSASLALSGCATTVPNTRVCAVAGVLTAGADCAHTLSDETESLTLEQFIDFLEPAPERPDPAHPGQVLPARGPAMCQSADDWGKAKTALEQLCEKAGSRCTYEMKQKLAEVAGRIDRLQLQTLAKPKGLR
jgi:hypothetical protein